MVGRSGVRRAIMVAVVAVMVVACGGAQDSDAGATEPGDLAIADSGDSTDAVDDESEAPDIADEQDVDTDTPNVDKIVELPQIRHYGGDAHITGTLRADSDRDGGCMWLEQSDGSQYGIAWITALHEEAEDEEHYAYRVRFYDDGSPAELLDRDDTVLAAEGDELDLGGGYWALERIIDQLDGDEVPCNLGDEVVVAYL